MLFFSIIWSKWLESYVCPWLAPPYQHETNDAAENPTWSYTYKNWFKLMFPLLLIVWNTLGIKSCWLQNSCFFYSLLLSGLFVLHVKWISLYIDFCLMKEVLSVSCILVILIDLIFSCRWWWWCSVVHVLHQCILWLINFQLKMLEFRNKFKFNPM